MTWEELTKERRQEMLLQMAQYLTDTGRIRARGGQTDIANALGMSRATNVNLAFRGERRFLTAGLFARINAAFGEPFRQEWLETGEGDMLRPEAPKQTTLPLETEHAKPVAPKPKLKPVPQPASANADINDRLLEVIRGMQRQIDAQQLEVSRLLGIIEKLTDTPAR